MSRLMKIQHRLEFNERYTSSSCQAIVCPDGPPGSELNNPFAVTWDCNDCMIVSKERYDRFMKELECLV